MALENVDLALGCMQNPAVVAACFTVHARLSFYNGNPSYRLWPVNSKRLLGVIDDEEFRGMPKEIRSIASFEKELYGDFLVCPFSQSVPHHMQYVCIESASHIHVLDVHSHF